MSSFLLKWIQKQWKDGEIRSTELRTNLFQQSGGVLGMCPCGFNLLSFLCWHPRGCSHFRVCLALLNSDLCGHSRAGFLFQPLWMFVCLGSEWQWNSRKKQRTDFCTCSSGIKVSLCFCNTWDQGRLFCCKFYFFPSFFVFSLCSQPI